MTTPASKPRIYRPVRPTEPPPKPVIAVLRYASKHIIRVLGLTVGGTLLAWLAVWQKARGESSEIGHFGEWITKNLFQHWWVNLGDIVHALNGLLHTLLLVVSAILLSGLMSALVGWKSSRRPHARYWDLIDNLMNFLGGIPVFFLCFLLRDYRFEMRYEWGLGWMLPIAAVAILAWGEGNASLWTRVFRRQFERLRGAPHIQAAMGRGLPIGWRLWRDTAGTAIESLGSRAVILLGAAAIVEWMLDFESGIGYAIINQFQTTSSGVEYSTWAAQVFVLVTVVALFRGLDAVARDWLRQFATA